MKKAFYLLAIAVMAFTACEKTPEPIAVNFDKRQYVVLADAATDITVTLSRADDKPATIPINFAGDAVKGTDYTVSADIVTFAAGSTSSTITITPKDNYAEKSIVLTLGNLPEGYVAGFSTQANVAVEAKETLIYSFAAVKTDVLDKTVLKVNITGLSAGDKWVATEDIDLPYKVEGDAVEIVEDAIKIKKGSNYGTLTVRAKDLALDAEAAKVIISVDAAKAGPRFAEGTNKSIELTVKGVLKISSLLGTWNFGGIYGSDPTLEDEDGLESWFFLMDDDPDLLPVNNEGFSLTFEEVKDEDGNVTGYKIIPGGKGDFNNFFRESSITWTAPVPDKMTKPDGIIISDYCSQEVNMWVAMYDMNLEDVENLTWFTLNANRTFDNSNEKIAPAAIALRIGADGELVLHIKDYDQPPFGENWWYDVDMFSFASWFTKAK